MDFEFFTDVTGLPLAKCDVESEAFADWLSHDLGADKPAVHSLLNEIHAIQNKPAMDLTITGKIYHLNIADDEVELFLNNAELSQDDFDDLVLDGPAAGCGLADFTRLLESWAEFIGV